MRATTVVYCGTSLDGFIARPDGAIDWLSRDDEPSDEDYGWSEFFASIDGIVMGRKTFEQVMSFDDWPYGDKALTVLSGTLRALPAGLPPTVELSAEEPAALLARLGAQGRKRIYVDGGKTVQSFLRAGLIDELVLTRLPILIGQGIPLFGPLDADLEWIHVGTEVYPSGLVKSRYRRCG